MQVVVERIGIEKSDKPVPKASNANKTNNKTKSSGRLKGAARAKSRAEAAAKLHTDHQNEGRKATFVVETTQYLVYRVSIFVASSLYWHSSNVTSQLSCSLGAVGQYLYGHSKRSSTRIGEHKGERESKS